MGIKISELTEATSVDSSDYLIVDDGKDTQKAKATNMPISTLTQNALDTLTTEVNTVKGGTMVINGTTVTFTITES